MPNFHDKWRSWSTLTESQLLSEGRKEDAAKKYPEVAQKRVELDGDNLLDILIAADPSGNQKYLMNAARLVYQAMEMADRDGGARSPHICPITTKKVKVSTLRME